MVIGVELSTAERELVADVTHLLRDVGGFGGVYVFEYAGQKRIQAIVDDDGSHIRAWALLTVVACGVPIDVVSSRSKNRRAERVALSGEDLSAAAERAAARRAEWSAVSFEADVHLHASPHAKRLFVASIGEREHCESLRRRSSVPLGTYGTPHAERLLAMFSVHGTPDLVVLDHDIPGATDVEGRIRASYPLAFADPERVQWLSTSRGLGDEDLARILRAVGAELRLEGEPELAFSRYRFFVIDDGDGGLAKEVIEAAPGADVVVATSWQVSARAVDFEAFDLFVVRLASARALRHVVAARALGVVPPPVFALDETAQTELGELVHDPHLKFIFRPVTSKHLARALGHGETT